MVNLYVAITDGDWFEFLQNQAGLAEVNFWQPGGRTRFAALQPGELFLFKLHSPQNFVVGGGVFAHSTFLPVSLAWEAFGLSNGAGSLEEMRVRIARYRREPIHPDDDFEIGCRLLQEPFFFPRDNWIPVPDSWRPQTQVGKIFRTEEDDGRALWEAIQLRLEGESSNEFEPSGPKYGTPTLISPRLGQGAFRVLVTDAYNRQCSFTGEKVLPVLEAAHIRPYPQGGEHVVRNGLLLRRDLHTLFDRGYMTITTDCRIEVSGRIKVEFDNGQHYYGLHGQAIRLPTENFDRPSKEPVRWHNENVFRS